LSSVVLGWRLGRRHVSGLSGTGGIDVGGLRLWGRSGQLGGTLFLVLLRPRHLSGTPCLYALAFGERLAGWVLEVGTPGVPGGDDPADDAGRYAGRDRGGEDGASDQGCLTEHPRRATKRRLSEAGPGLPPPLFDSLGRELVPHLRPVQRALGAVGGKGCRPSDDALAPDRLFLGSLAGYYLLVVASSLPSLSPTAQVLAERHRLG
jgi:hypothetical protein